LGGGISGNVHFLRKCGIDLGECLDALEKLDTPKKIFERKIRYWECRPMPENLFSIVSPADARILVGSFRTTNTLFIKEKFFEYEQLLGNDKKEWLDAFQGGDFAIFRLTPDKYHYNHVPVAGEVIDLYEIDGRGIIPAIPALLSQQ
jgi:phosphatidylserine decarboxylase